MRTYYLALLVPLNFIVSCSQINKRSEQVERREFVVEEKWVRQTTEHTIIGFRKINRMSALLYKNMVITGNATDGLVAYDKMSGKMIWRRLVANGVEPSGILFRDRVYVGGNDGQFYCVDATTGDVIWTFPTRFENLAKPYLDGEGILYFLSGGNTIYALDASNGKQLWLYSRQDTSSLSVRGGSQPLLHDGAIYVGFSDGALAALNSKTGALKWEKQLNRNKKFRDLDSNPILIDNKLYVLGFDDKIYCLNPLSGDEYWSARPGGYGAFLNQGKNLFYASTTGEMISLDKDSGKQNWAFKLKEGIATAGVLYRGLLIFGESQGKLRFLDSGSGREVGNFDPGRGVMSPPLVDQEKSMVYFISGEANMYGLGMRWTSKEGIHYLR